MKATIFNIQRFCVNDGRGIRTTVFFKGCPLRCRWCSNPESQSVEPLLMKNKKLCTACGRCERVCKYGAITPAGVDAAKCVACGECVERCINGALSVDGYEITEEELIEEVMKDADFYAQSGGGVTFSGGEALLWADFVNSVSRRLHEAGIHTALESCACVGEESFIKGTEFIDLILFDIKHYDAKRHEEATGRDNVRILKNLDIAARGRSEIVARIPVIPSFNDSLDDARGFARLLIEHSVSEAELLPFHQYGQGKYDMLSRDYAMQGIAPLTAEQLSEYRAVFVEMGINCRFG